MNERDVLQFGSDEELRQSFVDYFAWAEIDFPSGLCAEIPPPDVSPSDFYGGQELRRNLQQLGRYRLVRRLGEGAQGDVYLGADPDTGRSVSIKVLRGRPLERTRERLRREAQALSKLDHDAVCRVYDVQLDHEPPFIVMAYVDGATLSAYLRRAKEKARDRARERARERARANPGLDLPAAEETEVVRSWISPDLTRLVSVFESLARGLHAAHEAGVIHRDVKPGNIMIREDGQALLVDFGVARQDDIDATLTYEGELVGTLPYLAPEAVRGDDGATGRTTDVYSLGVSLYECLTLRRPFEGENVELVRHRILTQQPPRLSRRSPRVPRDLAVVVEKAMDKDPPRRYQTALELADDLRRVRHHETIVARPVTRPERIVRWAKRNPALAMSMMALGLAVAVVATVMTVGALNRARLERDNGLLREALALETLTEKAVSLWPASERAIDELERCGRRAGAIMRALGAPKDGAPDTSMTVADLVSVTTSSERIDHQAADWQALAAWCEERLDRDGLTERDEERLLDLADEVEKKLAGIDRVQKARWLVLPSSGAERADVLVRAAQRARWLASAFDHRAERGRWIREESSRHEAEWRAVRARLERRPAFRGVELPRFGLIPLGPDPRFELERFLHLPSHEGPIPPPGGVVAVTEETGIIFVLVPGGPTLVGSSPDRDADHYDPRVRADTETDVVLDPFLISKFEVTQGQWLRLTGANPAQHGNGDLTYPVESVSWWDATSWLGRWRLALPTEEQWEYAARAGGAKPWGATAAAERLPEIANGYDVTAREAGISGPAGIELDDGHAFTAPVGGLAANAFGLHDTIGNVAEWCDTLSRGLGFIPTAAMIFDGAPERGGSFMSPPPLLKVAYRGIESVRELPLDSVGIRPVLAVEAP